MRLRVWVGGKEGQKGGTSAGPKVGGNGASEGGTKEK